MDAQPSLPEVKTSTNSGAGGNIIASVLAAGLSSSDGIFRNADDAILGGTVSAIACILVKGGADSARYFAAGRFGPVKIDGAKVAPTADARFLVG